MGGYPELLTGVTSQLKTIFNNQGGTIFNGVLVVLTFSGESVFRRLSFRCPCAYPQNKLYGGAFLFAPAASLFLVGILINSTTWRILHGCCYRSSRTSHGLRRSLFYWTNIFAQASVAPLAWLFIAFLDGSYYECFKAAEYCALSPSACESMRSNLSKNEPEMWRVASGGDTSCVDPNCVCKLPDLASRYLRSHSQILAWIIILVSIFIALAVTVIGRCLDRFTFCQNYYINLYRETEQMKFQEEAQSRASLLAENNCRSFFDKCGRTKLDWDKISVVPLSDFPHYLDVKELAARQDPYFSPLHEWVKDHRYWGKKWKKTVGRVSDENLARARSAPSVEGPTETQVLLQLPEQLDLEYDRIKRL